MIYEGSPASQLPGLAKLIVQKLKDGCRCVYLNSPAMVASVRSYLAANGLDVSDQLKKGALVLSSDESHLVDGHFDSDTMLTLLADTVNQALKDGYRQVFVTGDISWEFGDEKTFDKLIEYEAALERMFRMHPALHGICQYHEDTLPAEVIQNGLHSHRGVYINDTLSRINPYYIPLELSANHRLLKSAAEMRNRLTHLRATAANPA